MNLSLLIHTFNGYQHLWPGCLEAWSKIQLPGCQKYFGTDVEGHAEKNFGDFTLLYSGDGSWSDRLVTLLQKIPTDYVFYAQEDHWPTAPPPDLSEMMKIVTKNSLFRLQISPITRYYKLNGMFFDPKSKYLVSHQPSIWLKSFFLQQIRYNETPWINEYEGTKRLNNDPQIFRKIAIYDHEWFSHKCVKGKVVES